MMIIQKKKKKSCVIAWFAAHPSQERRVSVSTSHFAGDVLSN